MGTHHGKQAQRVVAPGRGVGHGLVPEVLELLLRLVEHLHALRVLVLQLAQLRETRKRAERAAMVRPGTSHEPGRPRITNRSPGPLAGPAALWPEA